MADVSKATQMNNGLAIQVYNEQSCMLMEKRMRTAYQSAIDELQKELDDFYEKYATNNKIDLQVAKQKLSLSDSENVKDLAEQYKQLLSKKNIGVRTQKKLDEIAAKTKVSRLEQLLVNCTKQAAEVGMKAKDEMIDVGSLMYKDGFGHTMFNIQKTVGMGVNFNMPSARVIKTASNVEWLGATFTDRTGYTLDRLTNNIEQIIPQLFIQGKNADEFGKAIAKQFNMSENAAKRDMRTLTTLITNQASILAYNNCEMVDEFEFVATLDGRTSDKCRAMDGKRFKLNEAAPFVNQPPLHYNCRSTTIPYFEDLDEYNPSERVARDEQGKTYMVPANMSYREWCTKHAQGLYANSDKTDWNYEPEKVLAYERIIDERRKLKALQDDRVVYQDSDFVINHDISDYSEEEINELIDIFGGNQAYDLILDAERAFKNNSDYGEAIYNIPLIGDAESALKDGKYRFGGLFTVDRPNLMQSLAGNRRLYLSVESIFNAYRSMNNEKLPKALRDMGHENFNMAVDNIVKGLRSNNGLIRYIDERKQSIFLDLFNDKLIDKDGNINIFINLPDLIENNVVKFKNISDPLDKSGVYAKLDVLTFRYQTQKITRNEYTNALADFFLELDDEQKAQFIYDIGQPLLDRKTFKIKYLADVDGNDLSWGPKLLKPKINEYIINKEQLNVLFYDTIKGSYAVVNGSLKGFDEFINGEKFESRQQLQEKVNETMTRINNIRKELKTDKTTNILSAEDYNFIMNKISKYYSLLHNGDDDVDILNSRSKYQQYVKVMGLNEKPQTMSRRDFESYTKKNKDLPVLYRAVTDAGPTGTAGGITRGKYLRRGILNDLMYGSQQYIGDGIYGDGLYFSTQPTHQSYGGFSGSANEAIDRKYMIKATFKSGTKKVLYDDLEKMINEYKEKGYNITDPSSFARSLGYHVIQAHKDGEHEIYYNIIDRSCLVVQDVDKESVELSPEEQKRRTILTNKASIRDMFSNSDELNMRNMQFSVKQQNSNLFSYNEIVAFDAAVNNEELATLIKFAFKDKLYSDELKEHLKIKKFDDEYNNVIDSIKKLATDDDIVVDYFDKKIKIKKQELYDKIMESFDDKASNEKAARSKSADAAKQVIEFIKNSLNSGTSFDDLVKLNNQLSVNIMANKLSSALDTIVDSAYSNVEDYIGISAKKELNVKQTKQKISDNVKQQMPTYDKTTVNNIKKAVNNGKSNDDAMRFIVDRMLLDDDVFSDLNILSNFENYIKEVVDDDDVYENAFNRTYDELYRKMDKLLDTDVPHKFVLYKRKDGTKVQTDLIFSDLEDWLFEMKKVKDSDVVAKSFVLEKIRYQIYNEYVNDFSRMFIGELKESEYDDVDKLVKSYNNKFIKRSQELIEQAAPKKASKGVKVGPHTLTSEEIKALERKDTYDFNELRRKAVKEFKYYKGTMKKAEIQNESLKQSEKISKNNEKYFHQTMLDIFEKNDFCMRLNKNVLPLIAQSKFMNQFETGSAPLGLTFNQRRVVAKKMFTIPEDAEGSEYEKYGFLGSKNPKDDFKDDESFTGDYGDSIVRFKKRNLMHRTTFTIGDSLFNCMHDDVRSSPVINPQIASIQRGHVNEVIYGLNVVENANAEKSYLDIQALTRQKYIELQYHGNLTIDDVESVTFNAKNTNPNNPEVRKIIAMLKERGIKCYLSNSKSEVIEEL